MSMTLTQFYSAVQNYLDATGVDANAAATVSTPRWDSTTIMAVGANVFQEEWANILDTNQTYRFNSVTTTTDANGQVAVSALTTGSADTKKYFYRVLSGPSDGTVLYRQTDFRNVPIATLTNYQAPWDYLYYLAGQNWQMLPIASGLSLTWFVSWTPTNLDALASGASVIDFPAGCEYILVWMTAGKLLLKGGAESAAAQALFALADDSRKNMLGGIGRLTTRPDFMMFADTAGNWGGT